jgi:nitrogen fixation protein NifQ
MAHPEGYLMTPEALYVYLMRANAATECDPFDGHILASVFAAAANESQAGGFFTEAIGIYGSTLRSNIERYFPGSLEQLEFLGLEAETTVSEDERCLRELLWRFRSASSEINSLLAILIARRATRSNHLWQDLGLANRGELSRLMVKHFVQLASRNDHDMKWKKFFYRMICRDEGFSMCTAPCCSECSDFALCFSDESGESLFARNRLSNVHPELAATDSFFVQ